VRYFWGAWDAIFLLPTGEYWDSGSCDCDLASLDFPLPLLGIYHELWEINEQLSGRKSQFRDLICSLKEVE
jgi:hypothetical protein